MLENFQTATSQIPISLPSFDPRDRLKGLPGLPLIGEDFRELLATRPDPAQLRTRRIVPNRSRSTMRL
jgi:hypothetical protein